MYVFNRRVLLLAPPHLKLVHILEVQSDEVRLLTWHPIVETIPTNPGRERRWLATTADDNKVMVFDVSPLALKGII